MGWTNMGWVRSCESEVLSRFLFCFTWIVGLRKWMMPTSSMA